jgi:hypothetical protein
MNMQGRACSKVYLCNKQLMKCLFAKPALVCIDELRKRFAVELALTCNEEKLGVDLALVMNIRGKVGYRACYFN